MRTTVSHEFIRPDHAIRRASPENSPFAAQFQWCSPHIVTRAPACVSLAIWPWYRWGSRSCVVAHIAMPRATRGPTRIMYSALSSAWKIGWSKECGAT